MAKERQSFVFRFKWIVALSAMPDSLRLKTYDAIMRYAHTGDEPTDESIKYGIFLTIKQEMDADLKKYEERAKINREIGKKGGRPPKPKETQRNPMGFSKPDYDSDYDSDNDSSVTDKINDKRRDVFTPPTQSEVRNYISEKGYIVNAVRFFTHYSQKGWKGVSDWKSKIDEWQIDDTRKRPQEIIAQPQRQKEHVATVITIDGEDYVEQYGVRLKLPIDYKPQPDIDYYWDEMWKDWRKS